MAIAVDQNYDKPQRIISSANLAQFAGVDWQLLVEKETHRPIIMDGKTLGGNFLCASKAEVDAVKTTAEGALTKAQADGYYLGKTAKASSATTADTATSATKATQDAYGNVITTTYATKTEANAKIAKAGARGELAGSETVKALSGNQTITKDSADTISMNTTGAVTLTFTPAGATDCAVKVIALTATGTTTLTVSGATWASNGEAPTWGTTGKHLVLVAHFIGGRVILSVFDNNEG